MNDEEIQDELNTLRTRLQEDCTRLTALVKHSDELVRSTAIDVLRMVPVDEWRTLLKHNRMHRDDLVRANVCEVYDTWAEKSAVPYLVSRLYDESGLVNMMAASAIANLNLKEYTGILIERHDAVSPSIKCYFAYALCRLGRKKYFDSFLSGADTPGAYDEKLSIHAESYHSENPEWGAPAFVIANLYEFVNEANKEQIIALLTKLVRESKRTELQINAAEVLDDLGAWTSDLEPYVNIE